MASATQGSSKDPPVSQDEAASCRVQHVVPTDSIFAAALDRLNRQSVIHVLDQIVHEIDVHCQTFGTKTTDEINKLRMETLALIAALKQRSEKHEADIVVTSEHITELRSQFQKYNSQLESSIASAVGSHTDVRSLRVQIEKHTAELGKLQEAKTELQPHEQQLVETLVHKIIANYDLSKLVSNIQLTINGRVFVLERLLEVLATSDKVSDVQIDYSDKDIIGAKMVLTDRTTIVFACTRSEPSGGKQVQYSFSTQDWKGVSASFVLLFERRDTEFQMCGRPVVLSSYDGVSHSNVKFDLCQQAGGRPIPSSRLLKQEAVGSKPDDLKIIEGIGPKIAELLAGAGIATFKRLASTEVGRLKEVLTAGGSRFAMADPTSWPAQAKLAANGQWDELKELQRRLQAGRGG